MITVTERAKKALKTMLISRDVEPDQGLRLLPTGDGVVLALDSKLTGDEVVEYEGYKVLLIGIEYFRIFDGATVDYCDTGDGAILSVRRDTGR